MGTEKLKIGELAEKTGVTKRTIDYYTNLGLLKAERSSSNYRYYSLEAISQIKLIEEKKSRGLSLDEISKQLKKEVEIEAEEIDIQELRIHMQQLEKDVAKLLTKLETDEPFNKQQIKKKVSPESVALMQSLLLLLP